MKLANYIGLVGVACVAAGCSQGTDTETADATATTSESLNGDVVPNGLLTRKAQDSALKNLTDESARRADTEAYWKATKISIFGDGASIIEPDPANPGEYKGDLSTLDKFRAAYNFGLPGNEDEYVAHYYNRGDLGIGREMHCNANWEDRADPPGFVACYVTNFAAGDDGTEFTFGLNKDIAFQNMALNHPFATVAMAYRASAPANQKVIFVVYNAEGNAQPFAALDRHAITASGVSGTNFNSHIPTNCLSCHGGTYNTSTHTVTNAFFLPFDLDQFEFDASYGDESNAYREMNALVREVATGVGGTVGARTQELVDSWYGTYNNGYTQNFNSAGVVPGWQSEAAIYQSVIRPMCRNCHVTSVGFSFNDAAAFGTSASLSLAVSRLKSNEMPHALQTQRNFWMSGAPAAFEAYLRGKDSAVADDFFNNCGPGNIVTLDPPLIAAVQD